MSQRAGQNTRPTGLTTVQEYALATGLRLGALRPETQGSDYESGVALLDGVWWRVRTARVTPTKPGAFVAVWRRGASGSTEPIPVSDDVQGLIVAVRDSGGRGVFRFPGRALQELGIAPSGRGAGKRGFRLYPPWCAGLNPQAARTQRAQEPYFVAF